MLTKIHPWQEQQWESLMVTLSANRMPHALVLLGAAGTGKFEFAWSLAAKIICASKDSTYACGKCHPCALLAAGTHPDLMNLGLTEKSKSIKVGDIREWLPKTQLTPMMSAQKIAIINDIDKMTVQAANSFLKTLEEPAGNTTFILISHATKPLLATIRSRCQEVVFPRVSLQQTKQWLETQELAGDMAVLAKISNGAPLLALDYETTEKIAQYQQLLSSLSTATAEDIFKLSLSWSKENLPQLLVWWQMLVIDFIKDNTKASVEYSGVKLTQDTEQLHGFYQKLIKAKKMQLGSINARLILDDLLLSWLDLRKV